ncbi:MAG: hypothetical protein H6709_20545 [Kofleriaceae bacterium]|nr:hypothetical protein [Kofleriaceae bacterium]
MRFLTTLLCALPLSLAACGGTAPAPAAPTGDDVATPAERGPDDGAGTDDAAPRAVEVVYGRMSYVMDSPRGQQEKAEQALRDSDLATQLAALGLEVTYRFDEAAGDTVTVVAADGTELGHADLHELDGGAAPDDILAAARGYAGD